MSPMTWREVAELLTKFKAAHLPVSLDTDAPQREGVTIIAARLAKTKDGSPDLQVRGYGRLLKHYCAEGSKNPDLIAHFNAAVRLFEENHDVTKSIKRARVEAARRVTKTVPARKPEIKTDSSTLSEAPALRADKGPGPHRELFLRPEKPVIETVDLMHEHVQSMKASALMPEHLISGE